MRVEKRVASVNTTKLAPPSKHAGLLVERFQLCEDVAQKADRRLVVVLAPAGYGKTSALAQVRRRFSDRGLETGWLSIDEEDNDLGRFLLHFVEAIRFGGGLVGQATLALLRSGVSLPAAVLKATLLNELAALEKDVHLFVDDFHLISDRSVIAIVNAVLLAPLDRFHLLVAARDAHGLPLAQLRVRDELLEVGVRELKFSEIEIGEFFARQNGAAISSDLVGLLLQRTEGWVAGLQFAAIALRDSSDSHQFLARFSGQHRNVGDFLAEEVLRRQPEDTQEFLLATCILKRFDTALCNAVTDRSDGRDRLDKLETGNLFIFSLDNERQWYRYHHLFSEFLQRRLHERRPDLFVEYHRRACRWLATNGFAVDAIEHAFVASDERLAADLLDATSQQLFASGQIATIRAYAARLPASIAEKCPQLQLDLAWDCELRWQFAEARQALGNARATLERWTAEADPARTQRLDFLMSKLAHREMMLSLLSDDVAATHEGCRRWLATTAAPDPFMRASTETALMLCHRETYNVEGAGAAAEMAHEVFVKSGAIYGTAFHNSIAGSTLYMAGDLKRAEEVYHRARTWATRLHGERSALVAMPSMLLAELHYERNRIPEARQLLGENFSMSRELGFVDNLIAGFITCARVAFLDQDHGLARSILDDATHFADRYDFERLRAHILCERVRQLLAQGETREAARLVSDAKYPAGFDRLVPAGGSSSKHELFAIAHARVCCETGKEMMALTLIKSWFSFAKNRRCMRSVVRLAVLLSKLAVRTGNRAAAQRYLIEALDAGATAGFVRSFLDEGNVVIELLEQLQAACPSTSTPAQQAARKILAAASGQALAPADEAAARAARPMPSPVTSEALSHREIEILQLACSSMLNSEIGASLGLAESTVKWYWQRIFSKLGVHRRSQAIQHARRMGLTTH
ncbi:LuxR C-terminal-related transcriptional regulator [Methylibium sp.]|uniref:LuxR C-terminal-related transcriptional regulator n=1 Tax=Methylibium sp. TaxID=2067992 RepID=UPI003D0BAB70